jgi:DNA polymerase III subunit alpha
VKLPWLNSRSHFSVGESLAEPPKLVEQALAAGLPAILLTDTMTVSGMPELFTAAKGKPITPIIGARLRIVQNLDRERKARKRNPPYFLRAIVLDERGWMALLGLLSTAFDEDHFYEVPRLLLDEVVEACREGGLILTLGDAYGALQRGKARDVLEGCRNAGVPLYADLCPSPTPLSVRLAREALLLQDEGVPTLISPWALYEAGEQADSLDVMSAIAANRRMGPISARHPVRSHAIPETDLRQQIIDLEAALKLRYGGDWAKRLKAAVHTTVDLPKAASFTWSKMEPSLPVMAPDEFQRLVELSKQGWQRRFAGPVFGHVPDPAELPAYKARLAHELGVIKKLGFSAYFLLVTEIVAWAKSQGVRVGPGRGSVGGSLIAYLLGITDVDPMRFGLLFERFINPERIDLPDADIDFASLRREEVVAFIEDRFGKDYVAGVANYNAMQAAGALNNLCRVMGVDTSATPAFSKIVPKDHGMSRSLTEAIADVPELATFARTQPEVIRHALNLEGRVYAYGRHAAGVIVAGVPLRERAVIERRNGGMVINWDKRLAEEFGLVKMDVLGLSTLDMMDISLGEVRRAGKPRVDLTAIPLDDVRTLAAFGRGETVGVFQVESYGARKMLRRMAEGDPLRFEDIVAINALNRPGPIDAGLVDEYIDRRNGRKPVSYLHPAMEDALRETYGVLVYQEQLMRISRDLAGFTGPEADTLRKAVGKKSADLMATMKEKFIEGAVTNGMAQTAAEEFWRDVEGFAAYSFNKSHSVAYSLISYQAMFLKVNHPAEFWAGVLSMVKEDRRDAALADMGRMGIKLLPPDVNQSDVHFTVLNDATVLAPFAALKGVSERSAGGIVAARKEHGAFASMQDFIDKVPGRMCHSGQREVLNKVGAFSRIEPGQLPADHPDRRRDQRELMTGLVAEHVIVDRPMDTSPAALGQITELVNKWKACDRCELKGLCHPKPWLRSTDARVMIVLDGPNFREEADDEMGRGSYVEALSSGLAKAGLSLDEVYLTTLVKSPKPESTKAWSTATLSACAAWLDEEIRLLRPPVIVVLGSLAFRHFVKGVKGGLNEHAGRVIYDKERDANILIGINPNAIHFEAAKADILDDVLAKLPDILPFA